VLQSLEDVTKLLPDDTWLTQFEIKSTAKGKEPHREILVRGESANAGRLISLLEESKLFEQAAPRSPTTKIQPGPGEIFDLGAQLKPLPPPEPLQFATAGEGEAMPAAAVPAPVPAAPLVKAPPPARPGSPEAAAAPAAGAADDAPAPAAAPPAAAPPAAATPAAKGSP
jgi:hypothetical protein